MTDDSPFAACDIEQVQTLVGHHLDALWRRPELAQVLPPLMLWGPPGVGKSAVVRQICEEREVPLIDVRLAQREPVDLRGLPVPEDGAVSWLLPAEWPREGRGIILFDELTAADRTLQVAAYELILDRRLGDLYRVPEGWYVMGAGNRVEDRAVATTMASALANRFCHLEVTAELEPWVRWAMARDLHPDVIGFLRFQPERLFDMEGDVERGWPSPRSWERVSLELQLGEGLPAALLSSLVVGLVGPGAGLELLAFREWAGELPRIEDMLAGRAPAVVPERADQRYALCAAVAHHLWRMPRVDLALRCFFELGEALPSDFAAMLMMDVLNRADFDQSSQVLLHPRFAPWNERHGGAFTAWFTMHSTGRARRVLEDLGLREARVA